MAFCEKMNDATLYDEKGLEKYKTLIPGRDGWVFRTLVAFKKDFSINEKTRRSLKALQDGFKRHGTDFVLLFPPNRGLIHADFIRPEDRLSHEFTADQVKEGWSSYISTLAGLKAAGINIAGVNTISEGAPPFFYKRDHHWSAEGARQSARAAAEFLKTLPSYDGLSKTPFVTKQLEDSDYPGAFSKAFKSLCETSLPPEKASRFITERAETGTNKAALFGDFTPEIVLMGTSNTAPDPNVSNFDGFLKEALSADVDNRALSGAGVDTSMLAYINSKDFKEKPAKIAVWEVPGYYDLNKMNAQIFLQAIPALYGDCEDAAFASNTVRLTGEKIDLLGDLSAKNILGETYYLHLAFEKPVKNKFTLALSYQKFEDKQSFSRSNRYPVPDGDYYLTLRFDNKGPLKKLTLLPHKSMKDLNLTTRICKIAS
ncbi:MAG: hypothetical protein K9G62_03685 [Alphaproteobacteria bacterium]|nr:hypothetical protein [Alphaproteobacteria bacterium]